MPPKSRKTTDYLTATDFFKFLTCPHWPYYDRFATAAEKKRKRELTPGEIRRLDDGLEHEREVMEEVSKGQNVKEMDAKGDPASLFQATREAMQSGAEVIYQGTLIHGDWQGRPDLLIREPGASKLGNYHYVPVDIKSAHQLKPAHRFQLAFYSILLERVQGVFPERAGIINKDHEPFDFEPAEILPDFENVLEKIEAIRRGEKPEPVVRKTCFDTGPWGEACLAYAQKTNDIALLYNVSVPKLRALRSLGITTVDDAAEMDPSLYVETPGLTLHGLETIKLQAESLRSGKIYIKKPVAFNATPIEIHFDIESYLPDDMDYLYGFLIRRPKHGAQGAGRRAQEESAPRAPRPAPSAWEDEYIRFLAERVEDEEKMWKEFLKWLETLPPDYIVYHYASYERTRLGVLESRYGGSEWLDLFRGRLVDLKIPATKSITYPLHFYSLKKICKHLGFSWRSILQSGGASIDQYAQWLESGDRAVLEDIVLYNEDDVRATAFLKDWMEVNAGEVGEAG